MRMILITLYFLGFISNAFSQPNNGIAFINNLPNMTVGQSMEIIIDGNGLGQVTCVNGNLEGNYNLDVERWILISGNWIIASTAMNNGLVTWLQGNKMVVRALSDIGNNTCATFSGLDFIQGEDSANNMVDKIVCVYSGVLPISYLSPPKSILDEHQTQITWSVATQLNNQKYIIEHSKDGRTFSPIVDIAGDGKSNETKHYEYIHTTPSIGINYYRIKQVDYDGKHSYSNIASVRYDGNGSINIYPNPATSEVTITTKITASLQITDVYGRILLNQDISDGQNTINISALPSGILIFVVGDQRYKVLKE